MSEADAEAVEILIGSVGTELDLCNTCAKNLRERYTDLGRPLKRRKGSASDHTSSQNGDGGDPATGELWPCDVPACAFQGKNAQSLAMHRFRTHAIRGKEHAAAAPTGKSAPPKKPAKG